jgi:DNA-binding NarL/FixJ family response regulator
MNQSAEAVPLRIIIVDDHPVVVRGLREYLENGLGYTVVGVAHDREGFLRLLTTTQADIALVDLVLSNADRNTRPSGIEVIEQAQELAPQLRCIAYSAYEKYGREALDAGARAYILKNAYMDRLAAVIKAVLEGICVYDGDVIFPNRAKPDSAQLNKPLTPRQIEILREWARHPDDTRAAIALRLNVAEGTVRTHLHNIYQKLDVSTRAGAFARARELGYDI